MKIEKSIIKLGILLIIPCLYSEFRLNYSLAQKLDMERQMISMGISNPQIISGIEQAILASPIDLIMGQTGSIAAAGTNLTTLMGMEAYIAPMTGIGQAILASPINLMVNQGSPIIAGTGTMGIGMTIGFLNNPQAFIPNLNLGGMPFSSLSPMSLQGPVLNMLNPYISSYSGFEFGPPPLPTTYQNNIVMPAPIPDNIYVSEWVRQAARPPISSIGQAQIPMPPASYYPIYPGAEYPTADLYPGPGPEYFIDTYNLGLDLFNPELGLRVRTPLPGGFIIFITETEEYDEAPITEDVEVYLYDRLITPERSSNGLYFILLQPGSYQLRFKKEGYKDYLYPGDGREGYITSSIPEYLHIKMERETTSLGLKSFTTHSPVLAYIPDIEIAAGERVVIEPQISDPDGDTTYVTYSGWMDFNTRYTTSKDIGWHQVLVTAIDEKGYTDSQIVNVYVYESYDLHLYSGLNFIAYPFEGGDPDFSAADLLSSLHKNCGCALIISNYADPSSKLYKEVRINNKGELTGTNFPLEIGKGYQLYTQDNFVVSVPVKYHDEIDYTVDLDKGLTLIGIIPPAEQYTAYDILADIGSDVEAIYRYDQRIGGFESAYWINDFPAGSDFEILPGEGYKVQMRNPVIWDPDY